jgi:hypothetical protein
LTSAAPFNTRAPICPICASDSELGPPAEIGALSLVNAPMTNVPLVGSKS